MKKIEKLLQDYNGDDEKINLELSDLELDELITTKFIAEFDALNISDGSLKLETARSAGSPVQFSLSPIERGASEEFLLEDRTCFIYPEEERIPSDNATLLLNRILMSSEEDLHNKDLWNIFEKSRKWKNTSRVAEFALVESLLSLVDHRPSHLHIFCRRFTETDISSTIQKCLLDVEPPTKYHSLFRVTAKTEMPLKQLIGQLDSFLRSSRTIKIEDVIVIASKRNIDGSCQKFLSADVGGFAELEHKLISMSLCSPMIATARFEFSVVNKPFLTVNVAFNNEFDLNGRRCKTIVIEQQIKPLPDINSARRVTFGSPLVTEIVEFEIAEGLPFHPLRFPSKISDLIDYLQSIESAGGSNLVSYNNITHR